MPPTPISGWGAVLQLSKHHLISMIGKIDGAGL